MPAHHAQYADAVCDCLIIQIELLGSENLFQPVLDRFELRAEQPRLDLFQQLLHGQQCMQFVRIEPDAWHLKQAILLSIVIIAVAFPVIENRCIEIQSQRFDGTVDCRPGTLQLFFERLVRHRQGTGC